jgi:cell division protein FtsB
MRDIGARINRYRLSRYAPPANPWRRHRRWIALGAVAWMVWAGFISDHSFFRLWRLEREAARERRELKDARAEVDRLNTDLNDPRVRKVRAEGVLRENGWAGKGEIVYRIQKSDSVGTTQ